MKPKSKPKPKPKAKARRNNSAGTPANAAPSRTRPRLPRRASAPPWKTIAAAVAGGAGGAAFGGMVVNQKILSPEAVGLGLMLGGGATALYSDGNTRVVGTSLAAAGAGQLALAIMARQALKAHGADHDDDSAGSSSGASSTSDSSTASSAPPALPPPPKPPAPSSSDPPRKNSRRGAVASYFRDASDELDLLDDDRWSYPRDAYPEHDEDDVEYVELPLDYAA